MDGRIETNGDYFKNTAIIIGDRTRPDRITATRQTASNRGSNRMIFKSQSDLSMYRLKRRRSLADL